IAERLTGKPVDTYKNAYMDRGNELEPMARMAYELASDRQLERVGFIEHDTLLAGCSPDALHLRGKRGVEFKSVTSTTQVQTSLAGGYPSEHKAQIQGSLWLSEFDSWDFCSYCPEMPAHLRTYIFTVKRDEDYIKTIDTEVRRFLADVEA